MFTLKQRAVLASALLACCFVVPAIHARGSDAEAKKAARTEFRRKVEARFPDLFKRIAKHYGWFRFEADEWTRQEAEDETELPARVIVLVHGVDEPGKLWRNLAPALNGIGYTVLMLRYPNDQPIRDSAAFFAYSLSSLRERAVAELVIVAHSMGGLVSREMLTNPDLEYETQKNADTVPRVRALIMFGTPNHGSKLARFRVFAEVRDQWCRFVAGEGHLLGGLADGAGEAKFDLLPESTFLCELNARPHPESVLITSVAGIASPFTAKQIDTLFRKWRKNAGSTLQDPLKEMEVGVVELAEGIGDGAVSLASTRLEGVSDHVTVRGNHITMVRNVTRGNTRIPPAVPIVLKRLNTVWGSPDDSGK